MAALRVANPPERPLAVFDGDCGFCRQWIERWRARTGPRVDYAPSQEVAPRFPEIPPEAFARAFQLVLPDGRVLEGAAAVLATLERGARRRRALRRSRGSRCFGGLLELAYRLVARHRPAATRSDAPALGTLGREAHVLRGERALSPRARSLLPRRVRLAVGPGGRAHRRARNPAGRPVSRLGAGTDRLGAVLAPADALLDLLERRVPAPALRRRRRSPRSCSSWGWRRRRPRRSAGFSTSRSRSPARCSCSSSGTTCCSRSDCSRSSSRRRGAGDSARGLAAVAGRALPPALAPLPADVLVGLGQARERRPDLAQPHGAALPLRDAAAAALDRVVPAPAARRGSRRSRRSFSSSSSSSFRFSIFAPRRLRLFAFRATVAAAAAHRRDGQLRVLQPADARARRPARRRPVASRRAGGARPRRPPASRARGRRPSSFRSRPSCSSRRRSSSPERSTARSRCRARSSRPRGAWRRFAASTATASSR